MALLPTLSSLPAEVPEIGDARTLVADLCRQFYTLGWVSGTGGSISLKVNDSSRGNAERIIVMAPSGVQKERMLPEDMYVMDKDGNIITHPIPKPPPHKAPKCSECAPLFLKAYQMRGAGAVIHSHGMEACLATMIHPGAKEFRVSHLEMIKGIVGHGYDDQLVVPIIENTAREYELTDSLAAAMEAYPASTAVLVRNHGLYVWGDNWIQAKTQAECYHYLFDAAIRLTQMGLDPADPQHGPLQPQAPLAGPPSFMLLDIEGTTTPIDFVTKILFPYAHSNVRTFLEATYETEETREDLSLLRAQVDKDREEGNTECKPIPGVTAKLSDVIRAAEAAVQSMIAQDRKVPALKQLQGHIWRVGYAQKEIVGDMFPDVEPALRRWHAAGKKTYIYSSGSREAQRLIFGCSRYGDLRPLLSGFFDTSTGNKREKRSYREIALSLGVEDCTKITFCTDVYEEAKAAKDAGLSAVLVVRPGNAPLPAAHSIRQVESLADL